MTDLLANAVPVDVAKPEAEDVRFWSVTTIIGALDKPALVPWAANMTAEEAVRVARLARAGGLPDWIKLEVIPDPRYLLPDGEETLLASEQLVADGFTVLPYVLPDPVLQRKLEA
ncbi:MAG: thiazole synthase, partial [Acidimicrobiales bacterium]